LGYTNIHSCDSGSGAITVFSDLVSQNKNPVVFLDFMLPDMDARSVLTQILNIQPNARVVLETATEKDDEGIKELIRLGVYQYIEKPIRFENLKAIIDTIENEQSFFEKESEQIKLLKDAHEKTQSKVHEQIDFLLKSSKQISLNLIQQQIDSFDDSVVSYIDKLESEGKILSIGEKKEIACNQCDSVKITQMFYCPSCKGSNFKLGKLLEHYDCGNISEENTYENDMCPNCNKEIKALGVDYRVLQNHYICNDCKEFFPEILTDYLCLKCENKFKLEDARWKSSKNYKIISM
jgi:response regulator of citrate/malate metabolism